MKLIRLSFSFQSQLLWTNLDWFKFSLERSSLLNSENLVRPIKNPWVINLTHPINGSCISFDPKILYQSANESFSPISCRTGRTLDTLSGRSSPSISWRPHIKIAPAVVISVGHRLESPADWPLREGCWIGLVEDWRVSFTFSPECLPSRLRLFEKSSTFSTTVWTLNTGESISSSTLIFGQLGFNNSTTSELPSITPNVWLVFVISC